MCGRSIRTAVERALAPPKKLPIQNWPEPFASLRQLMRWGLYSSPSEIDSPQLSVGSRMIANHLKRRHVFRWPHYEVKKICGSLIIHPRVLAILSNCLNPDIKFTVMYNLEFGKNLRRDKYTVALTVGYITTISYSICADYK